MPSLAPLPKFRFFTAGSAGTPVRPLVGGKVYFYEAGTTTPKDTYTSSTGLVANTNPVILNSRGEADIWLGSGAYKMVVTDASDVQQGGTVDNIKGTDQLLIEVGVLLDSLRADLANTADTAKGDAAIGVKQPYTGAEATTQHEFNARSVSVLDFDKDAGGNVLDDSAAVQAAIDYVKSLGRGSVVFPPGRTYYLNAQINLCDNLALIGYGAKIRIGHGFDNIDAPLFKNFSGTSLSAPGTRLASQNLTVLGFDFDGEDPGGTAGVLIADAAMRGPIIGLGGKATSTGMNGVTIRDCRFHDYRGTGLGFWDTSNIEISGNKFTNFFANVSLSVGSGIDMHDCSNAEVFGNWFTHTAAGPSWHSAVFLDRATGCSNFHVHHNIVTNMNGGDGFSCEGNGGANSNMENGVFESNIILNCEGQGLSLDNCKSVKATGNIIRGVIGPAILGTGTPWLECTGNTIEDSGLGGIISRSGTMTARVAFNDIREITYFDANYRGHGIELVNATTGAILVAENNTIQDTDGAGVYLVSDSGSVVENPIRNAGRSASNSNQLRAGVFAAGNVIVADNRIASTGNTQYAVSSGAGEFPNLDNNRLTGTFGTAFYYIGYRSGLFIDISVSIEDARFDARTNVFTGRYAGTPAGYWYRGDTMYQTAPSAGGFIGSVATASGTTWKTFGAISA